jgi:hypothetical protein
LVKDLDSEMWELSIFKKSENSNKFPKNQVLEGKIS